MARVGPQRHKGRKEIACVLARFFENLNGVEMAYELSQQNGVATFISEKIRGDCLQHVWGPNK
jgi:hypothetical protein